MDNNMFADFLAWERTSRDTIDFKKVYVDMAGDLIAGLVLSQIIYWYLPGRDGTTKLRVSHDGELWIAKARREWWDEVRVGPRQLDRAVDILKRRGLVIAATYNYAGTPMLHIRLDRAVFIQRFQECMLPIRQMTPPDDKPAAEVPSVQSGSHLPDSSNPLHESVTSITENTTETTLIPLALDAPIEASKEQINLLFNAIADEFYQGARAGNSAVARIIHGIFEGPKSRRVLRFAGLVARECERQHKQPGQLDFEALAKMVPQFGADFRNGQRLELRDPEKFVLRWEGWRNEHNRPARDPLAPPPLMYDPNCPNHCDHGVITVTIDGKEYADHCECQKRIVTERGGRLS